jgi:putative tryptophan/tyrosine transport system substrate-binding protein
MATSIERRQFISALGGAAVSWPLAASAQQSAMPVIGLLYAGSPEQNVQRLTAYRKGLSDAGFVEGQNVVIEFRWTNGHDERLPDMAADLIRRQVAVIAAPNTPSALAAKAATTTIPIVFVTAADPVAVGLVASLNRPGGNVTGVASLNTEIAVKRLGIIRELAPQTMRYFALVNPTSALADPFTKDLEAGAANLGIHVEILNASTAAEIDAAFAKLPQQPGAVLLVSTDAFFFIRRAQIIVLAARQALPVMFDNREFAVAGGLVSYGADLNNALQLAGAYTGRILKGEKPADLPVLQTTKFEFVINLETAKALGLTVPSNLLAITDEVIE